MFLFSFTDYQLYIFVPLIFLALDFILFCCQHISRNLHNFVCCSFFPLTFFFRLCPNWLFSGAKQIKHCLHFCIPFIGNFLPVKITPFRVYLPFDKRPFVMRVDKWPRLSHQFSRNKNINGYLTY